ncbi:MAG: glycoside hydrolase family 38 C-terminal domain-containing protein [Acidimicrobiia bacterium]
MAIPVTIVPHTHWDREWHQPFQVFRARLVHLLDELLPMLEADPSYTHFLLDGQTAVVDDYLAMRPERAADIAALARAGRVALGPWAIQMDEYMVSGETIVRDLQAGIARAEQIGGVMEVGYLPDMFGHIAQMPQLFALADFAHAVVWRGVPSTVTQTAFWWEAPDGSRVRAEYLWGSYSNGRDLAHDPHQLIARARGFHAELGSAYLPGAGLLLMNGTDHQMPQPRLGELVASANAQQDEYRFAVASLFSYLDEQPCDDLTTVHGELRSGARSNVLMGVASNRVDIHQRCASAERALERVAEPLAALVLPRSQYPHAFLDLAWNLLITNSAHDSSCACSADEVVDAVQVRYQEAHALARVAIDDVRTHLEHHVDAAPGTLVAINPNPSTRPALVRCAVPGRGPVHLVDHTGRPCLTQVVARTEGDAYVAEGRGAEVHWLVDMIRGPEFAGVSIARYSQHDAEDGAYEVVFESVQPSEPPTDLQAVRDALAPLATTDRLVRLRRLHAPSHEIVADLGRIPGYSWTTATLVDGETPHETNAAHAVHVDTHTLNNGLVHVAVDPTTGTLTITSADGVTVQGADQLVDGGDGGDTYNYSPPTHDTIVAAPTLVSVTPTHTGPVTGALEVTRTYFWPTAAIGNERRCDRRTDEHQTVVVRTTVMLNADEPFVRLRTAFTNTCNDHRLRTHIPLPRAVQHSYAECAFTVVARGLKTEGGPNESPLPTWVSRRFVDASDGDVGVTVLHTGLLEYELIDSGATLAMTLLRAVGYLSRSEMSLRPNPAGPLLPVVGAQMHREHVCEYAIYPHRGTWEDAHCHAVADMFATPVETVPVAPESACDLPAVHAPLSIEGAVVSSVHRIADGTLELRCFNPTSQPGMCTVTRNGEPVTGRIVNLRHRDLGAFDRSRELRPSEILTVWLDEPDSRP